MKSVLLEIKNKIIIMSKTNVMVMESREAEEARDPIVPRALSPENRVERPVSILLSNN